jgi:hypothetical protein
VTSILALKIQTGDSGKVSHPGPGNLAHPAACKPRNSCAVPNASERKPTDLSMPWIEARTKSRTPWKRPRASFTRLALDG